MDTRIYKSLCFLLLLAVSRCSLAQNPDSAFRRQHLLNRPDSVLIKDTLLFPTDTVFSRVRYTSTAEKLHWSDSGSITYTAQLHKDSAYLTLRADKSFIFLHDRGSWESLSIGRWWLVKDSLICLNWFDILSMEMAKRPKIDIRHNKVSDPVLTYLPTRIDHWWFVRRGPQLVPHF
jgi:hypothetical protein